MKLEPGHSLSPAQQAREFELSPEPESDEDTRTLRVHFLPPIPFQIKLKTIFREYYLRL